MSSSHNIKAVFSPWRNIAFVFAHVTMRQTNWKQRGVTMKNCAHVKLKPTQILITIGYFDVALVIH
jgi:hypothetical protein